MFMEVGETLSLLLNERNTSVVVAGAVKASDIVLVKGPRQLHADVKRCFEALYWLRQPGVGAGVALASRIRRLGTRRMVSGPTIELGEPL